jgi:hypothetical protein
LAESSSQTRPVPSPSIQRCVELYLATLASSVLQHFAAARAELERQATEGLETWEEREAAILAAADAETEAALQQLTTAHSRVQAILSVAVDMVAEGFPVGTTIVACMEVAIDAGLAPDEVRDALEEALKDATGWAPNRAAV